MINALLAQSDINSEESAGLLLFLAVIVFFAFVLTVISVAALWKIFVKAGQPGWAAIVPILNGVVLVRIAKKPLWWIVLLVIPYVSMVASILVLIDVAKKFGKSTGFGIGTGLLPFIFLPILGFGPATYQDTPDPIF